jgi:hypothetical protein
MAWSREVPGRERVVGIGGGIRVLHESSHSLEVGAPRVAQQGEHALEAEDHHKGVPESTQAHRRPEIRPGKPALVMDPRMALNASVSCTASRNNKRHCGKR